MSASLRKLTDARTALVLDHPFFGMPALRLQLVEDAYKAEGTAATDGRAIYYDPTFIAPLTFAETAFLIAHETLHCMLGHQARRGGREPDRWNCACDYAINLMVREAGLPMPANGLLDARYAGMAAEQIYPLLPEGAPSPRWGIVLDTADGEESAQEWQVAMVQAAKAARAIGKLPGFAAELLDDALRSPAPDLLAALRKFVYEAARADYSWARPNRRALAQGLLLPGLHSRTVGHIAAVIDTSGSVDAATMNDLGGKLRTVHEDVRPSLLSIAYCDAKVHRVDEFGPDDALELRPVGRGGTDFRPAFAHFDAAETPPACLIYLTDGYGDFPDVAPDYPVLWAMTTDADAPFGEIVRLRLASSL